mgnify:FL=1
MNFFGIDCSILDKVRVDDHTLIGARALITKSTDSNAVYITEPTQKFRLNSDQFLKFSSFDPANEP